MTAPDMLAAALEAYEAGLCVVQVRIDGNKTPVSVPGYGRIDPKTGTAGKGWKRFQTECSTLDMVTEWFADSYPGLGVICGRVSGNLEMLELEGRAVHEGLADRLSELVKAAGLDALFSRLVNGYMERTPSDGIHWLYFVSGDVALPSTKLAMRPKTDDELAANPKSKFHTLIETKGEGGFSVCAPSHGPTHKTGKPYVMVRGSFATIPTITADERAQLHDLCRQLSEVDTSKRTPPPDPVPVDRQLQVKKWSAQTIGGSWVDAVAEHLKRNWTMRALLEHYHWEHAHDADGIVYMAHPAATHDVSALINRSDRLLVFSSSTSFEYYGQLATTKTKTYDRLEIIAEYEHHGDRMAAARRIAEQTGILAAWIEREGREWEKLATGWMTSAGVPTGDPDDDPEAIAAGDVLDVDEMTGELAGRDETVDSPTNLPGSFWDARPRLAHIRQAAYNRSRSPDAVFGAVLTRVSVQVPPTIQIPPIVGTAATLDLIAAAVAISGGGKSSAVAVAKEVMPIDDDMIVLDFTIGSGEGLVDVYLGPVEEDVGGKKVKVRRQVKRAVLAEIDEGEVLGSMANRKGATLMPTLRSAWSGSVLGQGNATVETNRRLAARSYRFAATVALQPAHAIALLDDAPGGTPQRVLWFSAEDPNLPDDEPAWPGRLVFEVPMALHFGLPFMLKVDDAITTEVKARSKNKTRGAAGKSDPLDAHADLLRLKVAALLAILDDRLDINLDDWSLAGLVMATSRAVRTVVVETSRRDARHKEEAATAKAVRREVAIVGTVEARALDHAARAVGKRAHRSHGEVIPRSKFTAAIASRDRAMVTVDDAIAEAERLDWIIAKADGWTAGKARPA